MRTCDLFAGCGGLSKGFERAGFELQLAVECWDVAREVYAKNFQHPVEKIDLSTTENAQALLKKLAPEVVIGGPPCQDFSAAGERVERSRAELTVNFARLVKQTAPKWFVFENVPGAQFSAAWQTSRRIFEKAGYGITECVLNAAFYGVPQNRKRFFAIGREGAEPGFLHDRLTEGSSEYPLTVREFVGDEFGIDFYYRHPRHWGRRAIYSIDEPSPTVRSTNRPVAPGYVQHEHDPAPPEHVRPLTAYERARIQSFDRSFKWFGTSTDQDMMIANAVPVLLAQHVGETIFAYEEEKRMRDDPVFREWLGITQSYTARTAGNVQSRLKRACRLLSVPQLPANAEEVLSALNRRKSFTHLSPSVRSQIRKAVRLHSEFCSQ